MKGRAIIPLVLGLGIGLVAVKFVVDTLKQAKASGAATQKITAIRAKQDIGAFAQIKKEWVEEIETSDTLLVPARDRFTKIDDVVGRVTAKSIPQYSPILNTMLAAPGTAAGLEGRIRDGYRAVSVKIDEVTGVAYQIQPGDLVDVIVVMDLDTGDRRRTKETIAEVILQRIEVLAIGQSTGSATAEEAGSKVKPAKSATLLVTSEEQTKLHLAATRGKITLSLRGKEDAVTSHLPAANSQDLVRMFRGLGFAEEPAAAPPAAAPSPTTAAYTPPQQALPHGVTVYRRSATGAQSKVDIERITFENARSSKIVDVGDRPMSRSASMMRGAPRGVEPTEPYWQVPAVQPAPQDESRPEAESDEETPG